MSDTNVREGSAPPCGCRGLGDGAGAAVLVSVQHELRTPLTILRATTDTLAGISDEPVLRGLVEAQERALARLEKLIEDVLSVTQLVAEGHRTDPQSIVDVGAVVTDVALELALRDAAVHVDHAACDGVRASTVEPLFRLLLRCVLEDQVAFGKGASVRVRAWAGPPDLVVSVGSTDPRWHLVESTTYSPHGGEGLTILAARFLAERLGGTLEVPTTERPELVLQLPQRRAEDRLAD